MSHHQSISHLYKKLTEWPNNSQFWNVKNQLHAFQTLGTKYETCINVGDQQSPSEIMFTFYKISINWGKKIHYLTFLDWCDKVASKFDHGRMMLEWTKRSFIVKCTRQASFWAVTTTKYIKGKT